ncbi:dihydrofolate reductase [Bacillus sp. 1P06AnD]|uniref:dihydrofolate reductase n=1 Tax=Bacillus sp. 1P06AnD TaxID=3132208 RepID=UPI0039A01C67
MSINMIACVGLNLEFSIHDQMPWRLKKDLLLFKELTEGNSVVMSRKIYEMIGRPLHNRRNIVLTRRKDYVFPDEVEVKHSIEDILAEQADNDLYIIGGSTVFKQFFSYTDRIYLTIVDITLPYVDTFFPLLSSEWVCTECVKQEKDAENQYDHWFCIYEKKKSPSLS